MAKKTISSTNWQTDLKDWRKLTKDSANFILSQAESMLKETIDTAKSIAVRADRMITIQVPLLAGLTVYVFNNLNRITEYLPLTALISCFIILASITACLKNFKNYAIGIPGEYPKNIMTSAFVDNAFNETEQHINLVINQCENLQRRIEINDQYNELRMRRNNLSLKIFAYGLILAPLAAYLFLYLCRGRCS